MGLGSRASPFFATHEVSVRGIALRRIETTMQRLELAFLGKLPGNQRALIADTQPVILEIVVAKAAKQELLPVTGSN
jgi:hypothetical protein